MPRKELKLLARDLGFYIVGGADVAPAAWETDVWLYPLDWAYQLDREAEYFDPKDLHGIPLRDYPGALGVQYLPSRIAGYAIANWNRWRVARVPACRDAFLRSANWFLLTPVARYEHAFSVADLKPPWISCIAQGEAASVLCRAFIETGDTKFLWQANASIKPLLTSVEEGGLQSVLPDGRPFLEEYPGTQIRHVLNGCLYALVGLYDVSRASSDSDPAVAALFREVVDAVGCNIHAWNVDGWSVYDYPVAAESRRNFNTMTYQVLQAILLRYLATISGDSRLLRASVKWQSAAESLRLRVRALLGKIRYRAASRWQASELAAAGGH